VSSGNQAGFSVVVPLYNEQGVILLLYQRLKNVIKEFDDYELIFVNDGSKDQTFSVLMEIAHTDPNLVVINLSRNFGQQSAIMAGIIEATKPLVITMDGDLQDPPELIPKLLESWAAGAEIVVAIKRTRRETGIRRVLFDFFHNFFNLVTDSPNLGNSGTFGLLGPRAVNEIIKLHEHNRYFPGLRNWIGYQQAQIMYDRDERAAGLPKQSFRHLFMMGFDALFSFSSKPLRISWFIGILISLVSFMYGFVLLILRILNINVVSGFTTIAAAIFFLGGIQLISIGILGEYILRIYDETKRRPNFIIDSKITQKSLTEDY
jgi:dolichol-phosphate mannosyltransferase